MTGAKVICPYSAGIYDQEDTRVALPRPLNPGLSSINGNLTKIAGPYASVEAGEKLNPQPTPERNGASIRLRQHV